MLRKLVCAAMIAALMPAVAYAEEGDAFRGKAYAQQICAGCHAIEKDQANSPVSPAPPFAAIVARSESWNTESFSDWLGTRHPTINGVAIKPAVAADLLVYIRSLGTLKQQAALGQ